MHLRSKDDFQASELPRSLRSSAAQKHGSDVLSPGHLLDSPETLTKKGKLSRVSGRSIDKVSSPPDERDDGLAAPVNRRMTRGMDAEEGKRLMAKSLHGDNAQNVPKGLKREDSKRGGLLQAKVEMDSETELHRPKLKQQDNSLKENKEEPISHKIVGSTGQKNSSKSLTRLAMKHASNSPGKDESLSMIMPKVMKPQGVTTRQKASLNVRPEVETKGETNLEQGTKGSHFCNSVNHSNERVALGQTKRPKRAFNRGVQEEAKDRFNHGDAHQSTYFKKELTISELQSQNDGCNATPECLRKQKVGSELDDPRELESSKHRFSHIESRGMPSEQDPSLPDSALKLRRTKRKRSPICLGECTVDRASDSVCKDTQVHSKDVAGQDAVFPEQGNNATEEKSKAALTAPEQETEPNLDVLKIDPSSKSCLVATSPMETGGRQMRARPLDLEQPLLVLVEGLDEDYYELDGGSFHKMLQHQPECKSPASQTSSHATTRKPSHVLDMTSEKAESIVIPSFRLCVEPEDSMQCSTSPYVLPETYVKTDFATIVNCKAEYDMDDEDMEWLEKYNRCLSPSNIISEDQFEKIIDLLENKAVEAAGVSSVTGPIEQNSVPVLEECCICNGGENSTKSPVYKCESCHILVHQSCYGMRKGSKNQRKRQKWNCKKCESIAEGKVSADVSCSLCCRQGGALKPSTEPHRWAHIVCALYTNETYFVNPDAMELIDGLDAAMARANKQRRQCWLCGAREGSAERCSIPGCKTVFHVSCGVTQGASFELQHFNNQVTSVRVYCPRHAFEVFGPPKGRLNELEQEAFSSKHASPGNDIPVVEKVCRAEKKPEILPSRFGQREISGKKKYHEWVKHGDSKATMGMPSNGDGLSDTAERDLMKSEQRGGESVQDAGGTVVNVASVGDACGRQDEEGKRFLNDTNPNLMEGVCIYWVSKRAKQGGPLLQSIQQERAAKQFGIFNSDEDADPAVESDSHVTSFEFNAEDMKIMAVREQLRRLEELSLLVLQRERLKLEIFSLDQRIFKVVLEALNTRVFRQSCHSCKQPHSSVVCASCKKGTCMTCLIKSSNHTSWQDFLKWPKFLCPNCELKNVQMHVDLSCKPHNNPEDGLVVPLMLHVQNESNSEGLVPGNSQLASYKKPFILLPRSDCSQQSKLATQAFWDQTHSKKVSLLDLLKESN